MLGPALLVVSVNIGSQPRTYVYFPGNAIWYDYYSWDRVDHKQSVLVDTVEDQIPVYLRGGSIVPRKDRLRRSTQAMVDDPYTLVVALDSEGSANGSLYVDDGHSFDYTDGRYLIANIQYSDSVLSYSLNHNQGGFNNKVERIAILGLGQNQSTRITIVSEAGTQDVGFYTWANGAIVVKLPGVGIDKEWKLRVA